MSSAKTYDGLYVRIGSILERLQTPCRGNELASWHKTLASRLPLEESPDNVRFANKN